MSEPPRGNKRVKKGEEDGNEHEIFSRPEVLKYQNKALASYLKSEKAENTKLKQKLSKLEKVWPAIISIASLLYQQLYGVNDKVFSMATSKGIDLGPNSNLREVEQVTQSYQLLISAEDNKIYSSVEVIKTAINEAGETLTSMVDSLSHKLSSWGSGNANFDQLTEELSTANSTIQKLQNQQIGHDTQINNFKQKVKELKKEAEEDCQKMKVLQLRADRYFPYVKFENKNFTIDIPEHEWICHTCGKEMKLDPNELINMAKNNEDSKMETDDVAHRDSLPVPDQNLNDIEAQLKALKKINEALFNIITDMKAHESSQNQEMIKSRAFNRLLRNGHQILQSHEDLLTTHEELKKKIDELETNKEKALAELKAEQSLKLNEFHTQLRGIETQLKISEIEKENLQRELNKHTTTDVASLEQSNSDLKKDLQSTETENKQIKDDLQRILKEKSTISDRLNALRIEYDDFLSSKHKKSASDLSNEELIENQSKQIKDLIEELNNEKNQIKAAYSEMESIYQANQDLEAKNKLWNSKVENANKRVEKSMEESFKRARINENTKKEVVQMENKLSLKDETLTKLNSEIKILKEKVATEEKLSLTLKERENISSEMIKQLETEIGEAKKKNNDLKQRLEEADNVLQTNNSDLSNRMFTMATNFMKTGKIIDPKSHNFEDGNIKDLDENGILMLEIQKYKGMVKCPQWNDNNRSIRLKCKHTYCQQCINENIASRARKCPKCREKISTGDLIEFTLN